jgi:hypothetical protein
MIPLERGDEETKTSRNITVRTSSLYQVGRYRYQYQRCADSVIGVTSKKKSLYGMRTP